MNRYHLSMALASLALLLATGCEQQSIAEQEQIRTRQTLEATTPSATATNVPTNTPTATTGPSPTATTAPSETPRPTATITPLPPTATPNPALAGFSLCAQGAGAADGGRFSARITAITTTLEPAFERVTIGLAAPGDSAAPHAQASCVSAADDTGAAPGAVAPYTLLVDMGGWLHDDGFSATTISPTLALSGTTVLKSLELRAAPGDAGATLAFGLDQPLPFRLKLETSPLRLVLDVAKNGAPAANNDMLSLPATGDARPGAPLFYIQGGDAWKFDGGKATNLTKDTRGEQFGDVSALAASSSQIAFCAVAPGADVGDRVAPRALWVLGADGKNLQSIPLQSQSCDDPAFSPDGKTIALTVDETGANPPRLSIWTVGADGSGEQRVTPDGDEWSRFAPQWLGAGRLVYAARAEDGRSTLFTHSADGAEREIGGEIQRGSTYASLGRPLAAPDGSAIAVEGLRVQGGADLLLLGPDGKALQLPGTRPTPTPQSGSQATPTPAAAVIPPVTGAFWSRPLAWGSDGTLFYLTSACESTAAQSYTLHALSVKTGDDRTLAAGTTLGGFGAAQTLGGGLAYVTQQNAAAGPRGPLAPGSGPSALWFWDIGGSGQRAKLADAPAAIGGLAR